MKRRKASEQVAVPTPQEGDRRQQIVAEAARLFAARGFDGTSMRDIAQAAGMLAGSLYYHFASKEELFLAVHTAGMKLLVSTVEASLTEAMSPWDRLEAAAAAHCQVLLQASDLMIMVAPDFLPNIDRFTNEFIRQRDEYEDIFASLIAELDLEPGTDRRLFRMLLLGGLNWSRTWYRSQGGVSPSEIGRAFVRMLRESQAPATLPSAAPGRRGRTRKQV